jgi:DNA-binding NarL/FixJ family response regulator
MRLVIAEDMALMRAGLVKVLTDLGFEVVGEAADAQALLSLVAVHRPDVALVDIKMPPTHTREGLDAARDIRTHHPDTAVLLLSSYLEAEYAAALLEHYPAGSGYLLKDRVSDPVILGDALRRVASGECVIDPAIISQLMSRRRRPGPLDELSTREREVLALMAEGRSNAAIGQTLVVSAKTVETHVRNVFMKLGLGESASSSRRVLAVLAYLRA